MPTSPQQTFELDFLHTVKHSPIERTDTEPVSSARDLTPKSFLLLDIKEIPEYYSPTTGESIDKLLAADLVKTPVSFDSTPTKSEEEITMLPAPAMDEEKGRIDEAFLANNNHYQFHYPQPASSQRERNQAYCFQHPFLSLPESMVQFEAKPKTVSTAAKNAVETKMKRGRDEEVIALAPIQEKAVFAANPLSPPAPIDTTETKQQSSPFPFPSLGLAACGVTGLAHFSNVSCSSSQWGSLPAATASEAANKNTFSYPTMRNLSVKEPKSKSEGCRCLQSKCLKLYCACFRDGKICVGSCKCVSCANTEAETGNNGKVTLARQEVLSKKPNAFGLKSCKCAKSKCLKMYCACFGSGQPCGDSCKCEDCSNPKGVRSLPIRPNAIQKQEIDAIEENVDPTL
ncbi:hypothetical protein ACHAWT_000654 [Skeletonema menzelii]